MKSVLFVFLSAGLFAQSKPVASVPCTTKACQSLNELARGRDLVVMRADMACFYEGPNPANANADVLSNRTTDEFFLTEDGKKSVTRGGKHPGIFISVVLDGQPLSNMGYGPEHGGLADLDDVFNESGGIIAMTYDDLGEAIRFAQFWFLRETSLSSSGKFVTSEKASLAQYHEVVIRKSTKRFTEKQMIFGGGALNPDTEYHGRCYGLRR